MARSDRSDRDLVEKTPGEWRLCTVCSNAVIQTHGNFRADKVHGHADKVDGKMFREAVRVWVWAKCAEICCADNRERDGREREHHGEQRTQIRWCAALTPKSRQQQQMINVRRRGVRDDQCRGGHHC